jgi:uncharacterized membrane protein
MFWSQLVGFVATGTWVAVSGDPLPGVATLAAAAGAGLSLTICLAAFFQAMVVGTMSIVAPISATGVLVPIVAGLVRGERPAAVQVVGVIAAIAGIMLASRTPGERSTAAAETGLRLAFLAALGGGVFLWLMEPASRHGVAWAVFIVRAIPVFTLGAALALRGASLRHSLDSRSARIVFVAGLLGSASVALYALATLHGGLAIVSVGASLYPAVTVWLAYHVLGERVHGTQRAGIAAVLLGVLLIAA